MVIKNMWRCGLWLLVAVVLALSGTGCTKQMRKNRYLARGNSDYQSGNYDQAELEYLNVLRLAPRTPVALARLGFIYYDQGRVLRALSALQGAAELEPENSEVRLKLCLTRFSLGRFKEAGEDAQKVLKTQPGQEEALVTLAETAFSQKQVQDVWQQIERMRQRDKDRAGYHVAMGVLLLKQGQQTNVAAELEQALKLDPKSVAALVALGNLYWLQGDLKMADPALKMAADLSPLRSARRLRYADFKRQQGSPGEARQMLEELTKKAPDYLPAWVALARLALDEGRFADCAALLQKVLTRSPESYEAMLLKGKLSLAQGNGAQAVAEFLRMSELFQHSAQVQYELGQAYLQAGDAAKGAARLNQALSLNPSYAEAIVKLAELNLTQGEVAPAISALTELLKQQPQVAQGHFLLAAAYLKQKNTAEAIAVYRRMLQLFPKEPQVPLALATVLARENQREEARKLCAKALELSPDFLAPLETLADLDLADKQPQAALDRVNQQIVRRPSVPDLQLLLARIHLEQHDLTGAEAPLLKAIELAPELRTPYQMLAQVYVDSQRPQQALEKLAGFVARTNDVSVLMQIGMIQEALTNYPAARDAYERLLSVDPQCSPALNNLAYIYSEYLGQPDKALEAAEKAHQLLPNAPSATDTLGWVLFRKGESLKALPLLEEAASKLSADPEVQFHLGMVRYALGQEADARLALEAAAGAAHGFHGQEEARSRLAILAIEASTATPEARALLEKRVADAPDDSVALGRLARIYDRDGAVDKAVKAYEQLLKQDPKNAPVLARLSQIYAGPLKDPQKALELAKAAHAAAPADAAISQALGHLVLQTGDYKWAVSLLQEAGRSFPGQPALSYDLAWACYGLGQLKDAEAAMQNAQAGGAAFDHAEDAKRFLSLLAAYRDPAQRPAAAPGVEAALKADPNYVPALMVSGSLHQEKGSYQDARKTFEQVLGVNPRFAPAMRDLAVLCFERFPDESNTYDWATKARETFPDDPNLARVLGVLAYGRSNYSGAAQYLTQSLQTRKDDGELLYYLGMAQYQLKAKAESKAALQQALALNLQPKLADQARRVLGELK